MRICRLWGCVFVVLFGMIGTTQNLMAASGEEELQSRITELGLRVESELELVRFNADAGTLDTGRVERQVQLAESMLELIEVSLRDLPDEEKLRLTPKFEMVRAGVGNLRRAAALGIAPNRPAESSARVENLVRRRDGRAPPVNDNCAEAFTVGLGTYVGDSSEATNDGQAVCGSSLFSPDVWFRFVAPSHDYTVFETTGSSYDTVLSIHSACPGTMDNEITCNDDSSGLQSAVSLYSPSVGFEYFVRVSGVNGASGPFVLTISPGGSIEGTATRTGTGDPAYGRIEVFDNDGFFVTRGSADISTVYRIDGLVGGDYYLATDGAPDMVDELYDDIPCPGGGNSGCDVTTGDPVTVAINGVASGIDFVLDAGAGINGIVRDGDSGQGVSSSRVRVYDEQGAILGTDYTDEDGAYVFSSLPAGSFFLAAAKTGLVTQLYDGIECPGGVGYGCEVLDGTPVVVALNSAVSGIDFTLAGPFRISGVVTDRSTGLPLSSMNVQAYDGVGNLVASDSSNADGAYELRLLYEGTYFIATDGGYSHVSQVFDGLDCSAEGCPIVSGTPVVTGSQNPAEGIDFDLVAKGVVEGRVVEEGTGVGMQSVAVSLYDSAGSTVRSTRSDSSGFYDFPNVHPGEYYAATVDSGFINELYDGLPCVYQCSPLDGTPIVVAGAQTTSGIDFSIVPKASISGTVTNIADGSPAYLRVNLYDESGSFVDYDWTSSGNYEFNELNPGNYFVAAGHSSYASAFLEELYDDIPCWEGPPEGCNVMAGTPVHVELAQVAAGVDFELWHRGLISGMVLDASTLDPVESGSVYLFDGNTGRSYYDYFYDGEFEIDQALPGEYVAVVDTSSHMDEVWDDQPCQGEYPADCDLSAATPIVVSPGSVIDDIDFQIDRLPRVNGAVRSSVDGAGLDSVLVRLYDEHGHSIGRYGYSYGGGTYEIWNLLPGTYYAVTDEQHPEFLDQLYDGISCPYGPFAGCSPVLGTPIVVDIGASAQDIDFNLGPAGSIMGQVVDGSTGLPLDDVWVEAWDESGALRKSARTDHTGAYHIRGLDSGVFFVATDEYSSTLWYVDQLYNGIPCPTGPPEGCDPTKGTPVTVVAGETTRFIDLALTRTLSGVRGAVTNIVTGYPIAGVQVDFWDAATGLYDSGVMTDATGTYVASVDPGTYVIATDNASGWSNQIWDGRPCPFGSAFNGGCDPMSGDPVIVVEDRLTDEIDFVLGSSALVFGDGFESGDTSRWSEAMP